MAADSGNEHIILSEEQTQAFRVALEPVLERWSNDVSAAGIDGPKLIETARELIKKNTVKTTSVNADSQHSRASLFARQLIHLWAMFGGLMLVGGLF